MKCKYKEMCGYDICLEDDCPEYKPAKETNADRIRAMNDYELARFLAITKARLSKSDLMVVSYRTSAVVENLEWLAKPAEVE